MSKQTSNPIPKPYFYRNRAVNDLAWALLSPSLFDALPEGNSDWLKKDYIDDDLRHWLANIDKSPTQLYAHLEQQRSTRLGIYFEQLLSFYFEFHPRFTLLAKNLQINSGKKTIGELDFVVLDHDDKQYKHIEAAVKFYVGHFYKNQLLYRGDIKGNTPLYNWHHWVGPNQKDSLGIKMRHLQTHQLPLARDPTATKALSALGLTPDSVSSRLLLKGRFYLPSKNTSNSNQLETPYLCSKNCLLAEWYSSDDLEKEPIIFNPRAVYYFLPRQYWLSQINFADDNIKESDLHSAESVTERIQKECQSELKEWQLAELIPSDLRYEARRFFILNQRYLPSDE